MKALSIRQPWAWLITNGHKDIENRSWNTHFRGVFLVHASMTIERDYFQIRKQCLDEFGIDIPDWQDLETGGIVGYSTVTDCVTESESPWFFGPKGFVLENSKPLDFVPSKGRLNFYDFALEKCDGNHAGLIPCLDPECWQL
jgi:hypothetical protein